MKRRQRAGLFREFDAKAAASVMEIEENAAVFFGDGVQRARDELGAVAGDRTKDVAREAVRMNADERRRGPFQGAPDQSDVLIVVHVARISDDAEVAIARGKDRFGDAADVAFVLPSAA